GSCQLTDIMTVFANIGNWISGIIGGIVLMMYVIGGLYFLTSAGNQERVKKGKDYMRISTIGMLIVMFAYLGIYALKGVLISGDAWQYDGEYVTCSDVETDGVSCDINSTCVNGSCLTECQQQYGDKSTTTDDKYTFYDCVDKNMGSEPDSIFAQPTGCIQNLCNGGDDIQCCQITIELR
ncbi:MAG: pilin, partial [bacterium]|nr:pilin [bacterium]